MAGAAISELPEERRWTIQRLVCELQELTSDDLEAILGEASNRWVDRSLDEDRSDGGVFASGVLDRQPNLVLPWLIPRVAHHRARPSGSVAEVPERGRWRVCRFAREGHGLAGADRGRNRPDDRLWRCSSGDHRDERALRVGPLRIRCGQGDFIHAGLGVGLGDDGSNVGGAIAEGPEERLWISSTRVHKFERFTDLDRVAIKREVRPRWEQNVLSDHGEVVSLYSLLTGGIQNRHRHGVQTFDFPGLGDVGTLIAGTVAEVPDPLVWVSGRNVDQTHLLASEDHVGRELEVRRQHFFEHLVKHFVGRSDISWLHD